VWSGCYDGGLEVYDVRTDHARNVRIWPEAGYGWRPRGHEVPLELDVPHRHLAHDHTKVYVGSQVVHVTTDGGASWQVIQSRSHPQRHDPPAELGRRHDR